MNDFIGQLHRIVDYQAFRRESSPILGEASPLVQSCADCAGVARLWSVGTLGDAPQLSSAAVFGLFALSALGANICYSFAYALEFIFATEDPTSRWFTVGRRLCFVAGALFAMMLAFVVGRNIHVIEYYR